MSESIPRPFAIAAPMLWLLAAAVGCEVIPYHPRLDLADESGDIESLNTQFRNICVRSVDPPVQDASVDASYFSFTVRRGLAQNAAEPQRIPLAKVDAVRIYTNNVAQILGPGGHVAYQFVFESPAQCKRFADLLMSLRAHYVGRPDKSHRPPSRRAHAKPRGMEL